MNIEDGRFVYCLRLWEIDHRAVVSAVLVLITHLGYRSKQVSVLRLRWLSWWNICQFIHKLLFVVRDVMVLLILVQSRSNCRRKDHLITFSVFTKWLSLFLSTHPTSCKHMTCVIIGCIFCAKHSLHRWGRYAHFWQALFRLKLRRC